MGAPYLARILQLQKKSKEAAIKGNFAASKKFAAEARALQQKKK
ncbi:hypothetical protein OAE68_01055 [Synechococcus sp. AH-551-A10]|nr:hypothetical protein [Synechococcus sp. AH-551-A10]MDB4682247.1 hypothetical protein [Synechococcus sp. AH-551-A10]